MRERVKAILDRELARIDNRSETRGLELDDFRTLDLLIKAVKAFSTDTLAPEQTPNTLSAEDLLKGLSSE